MDDHRNQEAAQEPGKPLSGGTHRHHQACLEQVARKMRNQSCGGTADYQKAGRDEFDDLCVERDSQTSQMVIYVNAICIVSMGLKLESKVGLLAGSVGRTCNS